MSAEEVAKAFVQHFYQTFDAGVDALGGLYVSHSFFIVFVEQIGVFFCALFGFASVGVLELVKLILVGSVWEY